MAGHVATNFAMAQRERTEALRSMAYGGEGGGYGRPMPYGYGRRAPCTLLPLRRRPSNRLNTLDQLAAGGYITPEEYQGKATGYSEQHVIASRSSFDYVERVGRCLAV